MSNATAKWTDAQIDNSLENINLAIGPGRLFAIVGPAGAGKVGIHEYICVVSRQLIENELIKKSKK